MINFTEKDITGNWKDGLTTSKVSICCISYNHERYIEKALDGFLIQKTHFPFEILIDDDASSDETTNIIKRYIEKYPKIIKANFRKTNIGPANNYIENIKRSKGNYIAICEGDDHWIDPYKLEKQVAVFNKDPEISICFTSSENYDESSNQVNSIYPDIPDEKYFTTADLIHNNIANTCTVMYKNTGLDIPTVITKLFPCDWALHILFSDIGKIKYIPDVTARYRIHSQGIWSSMNHINQLSNSISMLEELTNLLKERHRDIFSSALTDLLTDQMKLYLYEQKDPDKASECLKKITKLQDSKFLEIIKLKIRIEIQRIRILFDR